MGCHSAAGLHRRHGAKDPRNSTLWPQLSADFSWLPEREAAQAEGGVIQKATAAIRLRRR